LRGGLFGATGLVGDKREGVKSGELSGMGTRRCFLKEKGKGETDWPRGTAELGSKGGDPSRMGAQSQRERAARILSLGSRGDKPTAAMARFRGIGGGVGGPGGFGQRAPVQTDPNRGARRCEREKAEAKKMGRSREKAPGGKRPKKKRGQRTRGHRHAVIGPYSPTAARPAELDRVFFLRQAAGRPPHVEELGDPGDQSLSARRPGVSPKGHGNRFEGSTPGRQCCEPR